MCMPCSATYTVTSACIVIMLYAAAGRCKMLRAKAIFTRHCPACTEQLLLPH